MTPTVLVAALFVVVLLVAVYTLRRLARVSQAGRSDLGAVSTRWISELRRDEPWTRS
jgi:hypothetical protein